MSLWLMLGLDVLAAIVLDFALLIAAFVLAIVIVYLYYRYGEWIGFSKSNIGVILLGKDRRVRLVPGRVEGARFLDMGRYGKALVEPEAVYKTLTRTKTDICMVYAPVAMGVPAEVGVFSSIFRRHASNPDSIEEVRVEEPTIIKLQDVAEVYDRIFSPYAISELLSYNTQRILAEKPAAMSTIMKLLAAFVFVGLGIGLLFTLLR